MATNNRTALFSAGEALVSSDLNTFGGDIVRKTLYRDVMAALSSTSPLLSVTEPERQLFTMKHGSTLSYSGLDVTTNDFVGYVYDGTAGLSGSWYQLLSDETIAVDSNAAGGAARYDVIYLIASVVDDNPVSRDFKDAVTGVLSTQTVNKSSNTSATLAVLKGTVGAGIPSTAALGGHVLAIAKLDAASAVITELYNCLVPLSSAKTAYSDITKVKYGPEISASASFGDWFMKTTTPGEEHLIRTATEGAACLIYPPYPPNAVSSAGRLLRLTIDTNLDGTALPPSFAMSLVSCGLVSTTSIDLGALMNAGGTVDLFFRPEIELGDQPFWLDGRVSPDSLGLTHYVQLLTGLFASTAAEFRMYARWTWV